jgi:hypothetical protein
MPEAPEIPSCPARDLSSGSSIEETPRVPAAVPREVGLSFWVVSDTE